MASAGFTKSAKQPNQIKDRHDTSTNRDRQSAREEIAEDAKYYANDQTPKGVNYYACAFSHKSGSLTHSRRKMFMRDA